MTVDDERTASWAFKVKLTERRSMLLTQNIHLMRAAVGAALATRTIQVDAWVVLPDHIDAVWTRPIQGADNDATWHDITARFTSSLERLGMVCTWQPVETTPLETAGERDAYVQDCLMAPVRRGLVERPEGWTFSSVHRDIREGRHDPSRFESHTVG